MSNPAKSTEAYYEHNSKSFIERTLYLDMGEHYQRFLSKVPAGGRILDAGCGSGRDAYAFKRLGYKVDAFDASSEMAKSASKLIGIDVQQNTFQAFTSPPVYDAIWLLPPCCTFPIQSYHLRLAISARPQGWRDSLCFFQTRRRGSHPRGWAAFFL